MNYGRDKQDVPVSLALAALASLIGAWIYFQAPTEFAKWASELDVYAERNLTVLSLLLFASTINVVWITSILSRYFGINRQGKRLEILTNGRTRKKEGGKLAIGSLGVGSLVALVSFVILRREMTDLRSFIPATYVSIIQGFLSIDIGAAVFVVLSLVERAGLLSRLIEKSHCLPEFPKPKNALVLGAVEDL